MSSFNVGDRVRWNGLKYTREKWLWPRPDGSTGTVRKKLGSYNSYYVEWDHAPGIWPTHSSASVLELLNEGPDPTEGFFT